MEHKRSDGNHQTARVLSGAAVLRSDVTEALTRVFFEEWARTGYSALSLERVARTAGVGKAALYRRWPDKASMAGDLLSQVGLTMTDVEECGSLEADLQAVLFAIRRVLRHPRVRRIITDLHGEIERTPALESAIRPFQRARRERIDGLINRAIGRGELSPMVDRELAADLVAAPLYWRLAVVGGRADRDYVRRLARVTGAALRASEL
jgi:AcrR family transcriptional regulator